MIFILDEYFPCPEWRQILKSLIFLKKIVKNCTTICICKQTKLTTKIKAEKLLNIIFGNFFNMISLTFNFQFATRPIFQFFRILFVSRKYFDFLKECQNFHRLTYIVLFFTWRNLCLSLATKRNDGSRCQSDHRRNRGPQAGLKGQCSTSCLRIQQCSNKISHSTTKRSCNGRVWPFPNLRSFCSIQQVSFKSNLKKGLLKNLFPGVWCSKRDWWKGHSPQVILCPVTLAVQRLIGLNVALTTKVSNQTETIVRLAIKNPDLQVAVDQALPRILTSQWKIVQFARKPLPRPIISKSVLPSVGRHTPMPSPSNVKFATWVSFKNAISKDTCFHTIYKSLVVNQVPKKPMETTKVL